MYNYVYIMYNRIVPCKFINILTFVIIFKMVQFFVPSFISGALPWWEVELMQSALLDKEAADLTATSL